MNIVNSLTFRHIKTHKKRSILTIMAIIVSVAMVTAVFASALSFVKYFQNVSEAIDGSWHSYVHTTEYNKYKNEFNNGNIDKYGIDMWYGSGYIVSNDKEAEFAINACDENYLDLRNVKVSQGRMPKTDKEILVSSNFIAKNKLGWKLGDKIKIPIVLSDKGEIVQFTIVGITESSVAETDSVNGFVYATDDLINNGDVSVYIRYKKLTKSIYDDTKNLAEKINPNSKDNLKYGTNKSLLTYSGITTDDATLKIMYGFCAIILVIIAVVSIFMIYDSFAVSYQERAKYLGMLASVGATKKQKRQSIYFEGFILGLIGIPLGILAGLGGIWATFKAISGVWIETLAVEYKGALELSVNWIVILGTVLASGITIFVSSYIPARKASKTTAIDAIKQVNTVKVKNSRRLRTSKLATKLLGYEGAMAVKNFKRNGRRSRTIVFSLFMSVVVFLSVANFSLMFSDVMKQTYSSYADLSSSVEISDYSKLDNAIKKTSGIDEYYALSCEYAQIDKKLVSEDGLKYANKDNYQVGIIFMDNNTFDLYLKQLGENVSKYHDLQNPTGILHNSMLVNNKSSKKKIEPLVNIEGKVLNSKVACYKEDDNAVEEYIDCSAIVGVQTTEDLKEDNYYYNTIGMPCFIMSIDMVDQIKKESDLAFLTYDAAITCDNPSDVVAELWENLEKENIQGCSTYSSNAEMESINNILTIVKVFVFGFIALITLISIMNIVNTISNSMNERRREFAMIRSIGMTPSSFKKMIYYESFRYGIKSLIFAIPISIAIHYLMYRQLSGSFDYGFKPYPLLYIIAMVSVFIVIGVAILYSIGKIKDDNIIETLKEEIN